MKKNWLPILACVLAFAAGYDALNRAGEILTLQDIPDRFSSQTAVLSSISTNYECTGAGRSRICRHQAYLVSESGDSYAVFMRPFFDKGLDRLYGVPEDSEVVLSIKGNYVYALEIVSADSKPGDLRQLPLPELNRWRSDSLYSAAGFLLLDGLIIVLLWRRIRAMSPEETKAFVKFTLIAFALFMAYIFFPMRDLPPPEELQSREITFSHVSRETDCPPIWPTHPRLTCDYTPYLVSSTGERWAFGPGYKLGGLFVIIPSPGTTLYLGTYLNGVYRIQRTPAWAIKPEKTTPDCSTKLVPVEDEGVVHWVCKGERYHRPADHEQKTSPSHQIFDRSLSRGYEMLKDRRTTLMSYDAVNQFHQTLSQSRNYLAGTILMYLLFSIMLLVAIQTFRPRKRRVSQGR
ncbi:MAG: hypothetical protein JJ867_02355 [Marinobacter sp.]|nr:hypothetical protein [Marinobacter sp.]